MSSIRLHDYQVIAINHILKNKRCALFMSMGGGKTLSTLTALDILTLDEEIYPVLIVAPLRVARSVWPAEVLKWFPKLKLSVVTGTAKQRQDILNQDSDVYMINFENLEWLSTVDRPDFKTIVVDESSKLRGFRTRQGTKSTKALYKIDSANRFIELTGTPAPQGLIDLFGQLFFIDKGIRLGKSFTAFTSRFFASYNMPGGYSKLTPHAHSFEIATRLIKDVCLTIDVKDYIDVDEPITNIIEIDLDNKTMDLYRNLEQNMFIEIKEQPISAVSMAIVSNKCLQVASGAIYDEDGTWHKIHDEKLIALDSILEEWSHQPVIVVYWFQSSLERLKHKFKHGKELDKYSKTIDDFNTHKIPLLFVHPQSAGHGLNLADGTNIMVFFDINWNLELYQQVIERIGPIRQKQAGLDRAVHLYYLLAKNTIDYKVIKVLKDKMSVQDALLTSLQL